MTDPAGRIIRARMDRWEKAQDLEQDRVFRDAVARRLLTDEKLRQQVQDRPERLIEMVFTVVDKEQACRPFFLNTVQREFMDTLNRAIAEHRAGKLPEISLMVLKGRQQGFTTLVTAYQLACCILHRNFMGFTLADKSDNAEAIFQNKAKFPYAQLPECLKPREKFNNRRQLLFDRLNSGWSADTATRDVGRSRTVNFFHGSECAFWRDGIAPIQAALGEAFTENCIKIYESTANGCNDYRTMWESNMHINCFYPWWKTEEYRTAFPGQQERERFLDRVAQRQGWIWERLRWLQGKHLAPEQLFWYWNKYQRYLDKDLIKQEYPCLPQEAFLLSGRRAFDADALFRRLENAPEPETVGCFQYDYDGLQIQNIRWKEDPEGFIKIYAQPGNSQYCIGGDTAGDGSDYFTGHVLDARTGVQTAVLRHRFDPDQYTRQMYCLGVYYGNALMGIEANFDSYPIREMQRLGYPNQYLRLAQDTFTGKTEKRFGFKTTLLTRPTILSRLTEIIREHCHTICDRQTLQELLSIIRSERGRIEAPPGGHDDLMMGLAIAHEIKDQVVFPRELPPTQKQEDYGEEIMII